MSCPRGCTVSLSLALCSVYRPGSPAGPPPTPRGCYTTLQLKWSLFVINCKTQDMIERAVWSDRCSGGSVLTWWGEGVQFTRCCWCTSVQTRPGPVHLSVLTLLIARSLSHLMSSVSHPATDFASNQTKSLQGPRMMITLTNYSPGHGVQLRNREGLIWKH